MNDTLIIKSQLKDNFSILPNRLLTDQNLSADATALLVYLLSKPANWKLAVGDIRRRFNWGRDKAYKVIGDCVNTGYMQKQVNRSKGQYGETLYIVSDSPFPEKPDTVLPDPVNQELNKERTIQRKEDNNIDQISKAKVSEDFNEFWECVPVKVARAKAEKAFASALKKTEAKTLIDGMKKYAAWCKAEAKEKQYIKHPSTWLNGGCWEDELIESGKAKASQSTGVSMGKFWPKDRAEFDKFASPSWIEFIKRNRQPLYDHAISQGWIQT